MSDSEIDNIQRRAGQYAVDIAALVDEIRQQRAEYIWQCTECGFQCVPGSSKLHGVDCPVCVLLTLVGG